MCRMRLHLIRVAIVGVLAACSGSDAPTATSARAADPTAAADTAAETTSSESGDSINTAPPVSDRAPETEQPALLAGAASRSILPTVDNARQFVASAPGWPADPSTVDPGDPGVYVAAFDQGRVAVGNGADDAAWVHDDLRVSALALQAGDDQVILVSADVYMVFGADAAEMTARAREKLPLAWRGAEVLIAATHNHHGPDTAFSVNDAWYELFAVEVGDAIAEAVTRLGPAEVFVADGEHRFGVNDARDPVVLDTRLNVLRISRPDGDPVATVVQWASHPETTLGWAPTAASRLQLTCTERGWVDDECSAEGRYFTADYPGVLRERLQSSIGGEVLYFNGAIGNQIGPGLARVWKVDDTHPIGDGWTPPPGALPPAPCTDQFDPLLCRSFAKTEAIGTQLAIAVQGLIADAAPLSVDRLAVRSEPFFTRLTNIGFRLLLADGDLGWQSPELFVCGPKPFTEATCRSDEGATEEDPVLTPLTGSRIRVGDVLQARLTHVDLGDVGMLFMPGEIPPELVVGVPEDFDTNSTRYRRGDVNSLSTAYAFPGYFLSLVDEPVTFTVGLGGEELGYWVPLSDYRLRCEDAVLPEGTTCEALFESGYLPVVGAIDGTRCAALADDPAAIGRLPDDVGPALAAACRYGQAIGRELGEPEGHYEETNAAGWDLVDDTWSAAERLFGRSGSGRVNPANQGFSPDHPPVAG